MARELYVLVLQEEYKKKVEGAVNLDELSCGEFGETALNIAASMGHSAVVSVLVASGADPMARNQHPRADNKSSERDPLFWCVAPRKANVESGLNPLSAFLSVCLSCPCLSLSLSPLSYVSLSVSVSVSSPCPSLCLYLSLCLCVDSRRCISNGMATTGAVLPPTVWEESTRPYHDAEGNVRNHLSLLEVRFALVSTRCPHTVLRVAVSSLRC